MSSGDIAPDLLRAAPVVLLLILSIRAWRRKKGEGDQRGR